MIILLDFVNEDNTRSECAMQWQREKTAQRWKRLRLPLKRLHQWKYKYKYKYNADTDTDSKTNTNAMQIQIQGVPEKSLL